MLGMNSSHLDLKFSVLTMLPFAKLSTYATNYVGAACTDSACVNIQNSVYELFPTGKVLLGYRTQLINTKRKFQQTRTEYR